MRVMAEATEQITQINGQAARVWNATTENGVEFMMFVVRVAVPEGSDQTEFQEALAEMPAPREVSAAAALNSFSARMVI